MQPITRNNHFVPQLYLKQWSDDGIHIWSYRILVSHEKVQEWTRLPISGVAYQRDLYTTSVNGDEVDEFEKWLEREFENPVQESLNKVLKDEVLTTLDWERLATFLGAQDVRTPLSYLEATERWRKTLPRLMEDTLEKSIKLLEQARISGEKPQLHSENNEFFNNAFDVQIHRASETNEKQGYIEVEVVAGRALWLESQKMLLTKTVEALKKNKWSIVHPAQGYQWFTCDHPVVKLNYYGNGKYDLKGGWGNKGTNIIMPLSPHHLLFTQIGDEFPERFTLPPKQTKQFQRFIAERAMRWIFAHKPLGIVSKLHPRHINAEAFSQEAEQWKRWHEEQSKSENNKSA